MILYGTFWEHLQFDEEKCGWVLVPLHASLRAYAVMYEYTDGSVAE